MAGSFVNPIGLENAGWKYLLVYVCWLCFEVVFIYFMFPETYGRTLEELTFGKWHEKRWSENLLIAPSTVFESQEQQDALTAGAHKALEMDPIEEIHTVPDKAA